MTFFSDDCLSYGVIDTYGEIDILYSVEDFKKI